MSTGTRTSTPTHPNPRLARETDSDEAAAGGMTRTTRTTRRDMASAMLEIDVTEGLRTLVLDSDSDGDGEGDGGDRDDDADNGSDHGIEHGGDRTAFDPAQHQQPRLRQHSSDFPRPAATSRPGLGQKAATAPPGTLYIYRHASRPHMIPRRAISERTVEQQLHLQHRGGKRSLSLDTAGGDLGNAPPLPRLHPLSKALAAGTGIARKMSNRKTVGRVGSKSNSRYVWRLSPRASSHLRSLSEALGERKPMSGVSSFSEKARVKEALERKKLDPLRTTAFVDFKSKALPGTPSSMVATPRELYGYGGSAGGDGGSARASPKAPRLHDESPLLPKSSMSSSPWTTTPRAKHFSLPLTPQIQRRGTLQHFESSSSRANNGPEKRTVYIPGPIQIEDQVVATPRKGSIATLDPFAQPFSHAKRFSDLVALDSIVCFFQELGVVEEASEEGIDLYWLSDEESMQGVRRAAGAATAATSAPSVPVGRRSDSSSLSRVLVADEHRQAVSASLDVPGRGRLRSLLRSNRSMR